MIINFLILFLFLFVVIASNIMVHLEGYSLVITLILITLLWNNLGNNFYVFFRLISTLRLDLFFVIFDQPWFLLTSLLHHVLFLLRVSLVELGSRLLPLLSFRLQISALPSFSFFLNILSDIIILSILADPISML